MVWSDACAQNRAPHGVGVTQRLAGRPDNDRHPRTELLEGVEVDSRFHRLGEAALAHVPDHADDRNLGVAEPKPLADGILARPVTSRELLVDHRDGRRVFTVGHGEGASRLQGDPHRLEVVDADVMTLNGGAAANGRRASRNIGSPELTFGLQGQVARRAGDLHARHRPDRVEHGDVAFP